MNSMTNRERILKTLSEKSVMKQDVFKNTLSVFNDFRTVMKEFVKELKADISKVDKRVSIDMTEKGEFELHFKFAGDLLIFQMHTNVFDFDKSHQIWKNSYVKENELLAYCGMINVYNFLGDSFKYNRVNDLGYLIARIFVNSQSHYFIEGKKKLGMLHNDFGKEIINPEVVLSIIEALMLHCLDFDLFTPPFDNVREITVSEMIDHANNMQVTTGKRLGFKFHSEDDFIG
jgi:hypothetical protein